MDNNLFEICKKKNLKKYSNKIFYINNKKILLIYNKKGIFFIESLCKHMGGSLEKGEVSGDYITCPVHGCRWNYINGKCFHNSMKIKTYQSKIIDNSVYIKIY